MATTTEREPKRTTKTTAKDTAKTSGSTSVGVIAGAVAGGAALGLLAMLGRKAAVQAPSALAGNWDDALKAEHKAVLKVFDTLEATDDKATIRRNMLLAHIKHALVKHAIEEENVIYPALREAGKTEQADELNAEHGYVKQFLYELENMPSTSPKWLEKVKEFRAALEKHIREEEDELFPELRAQLSEEKNKALTLAMNKEGFKVA
ncbi:hemerythrin domain-containing protein [Sphingomonas sp. R1]|uniref:hemerythrin domain-containing protein n=1 Tax=Sphingomonas sp. R1 TaxID=399176 RepID=UPI00222580E1|nr:hemerythrin domain-containing protein [Sphingomonas sp. R1]UYY77349.1 hemerythrin domain-containing protein [Sphingomonas sp. R1]